MALFCVLCYTRRNARLEEHPMQFDRTALRWTREPLHWEMDDTAIRITTTPHTDL